MKLFLLYYTAETKAGSERSWRINMTLKNIVSCWFYPKSKTNYQVFLSKTCLGFL
jgi:hypothetical protein